MTVVEKLVSFINLIEVKKKDGHRLMTCKAYNGRVVMEWLAHELRAATDSGVHGDHDRLQLATVCLNLECIGPHSRLTTQTFVFPYRWLVALIHHLN